MNHKELVEAWKVGLNDLMLQDGMEEFAKKLLQELEEVTFKSNFEKHLND